MYVFRRRARVLALAAVISLLLSIMVAPTALAGKLVVFDMNDRFARETGASGLGKVRATQQGSIEIELVRARNLAPNDLFQVAVTVGAPDPDDFTIFAPVDIVTSSPIKSDANGHLEINNFFVGDFDPGVYRVDIFVVHAHRARPPLTRDLLLACEPAPIVTVT